VQTPSHAQRGRRRRQAFRPHHIGSQVGRELIGIGARTLMSRTPLRLHGPDLERSHGGLHQATMPLAGRGKRSEGDAYVRHPRGMISAHRRYPALQVVAAWLVLTCVGSGCASSQALHSEHGLPPTGGEAPVEPAFELGGFARVQTAEISLPISEGPPSILPRAEGTNSSRGGCNLASSVVEHTIREHMPTLRACYERKSREDPDFAGKVTVSFVIRPNGQVRETEAVENSTGSPAFASCVSRGLRRIHFPRSKARDEVSCVYPFLFGVRR